VFDNIHDALNRAREVVEHAQITRKTAILTT
jgi:hypothetical protein